MAEWRQVMTTEYVHVHDLTFITYLCERPAPNIYNMRTADVRTYRNQIFKTASYDNSYPVALQYQFLGRNEEISFKYQGKWIYF